MISGNAVFESLVRAHELRHGLRGLRLVRDQRIGVHHGDRLRIARKVLVLEAQHVRVRKHVTQSFQDGEGDVRRRRLKREAFADEAGEVGLMFEGVETGEHTARAVTEHEHGKIRFTGGGELDHACDIGDVVGELRDVESLAIRSPAATQIDGVDRQAHVRSAAPPPSRSSRCEN